jgi:hypothetical protein
MLARFECDAQGAPPAHENAIAGTSGGQGFARLNPIANLLGQHDSIASEYAFWGAATWARQTGMNGGLVIQHKNHAPIRG